MKAQGGNLKKIKQAKLKRDIFSRKSGKIKEINNKKIISLARILGCPVDKFSGLYLYFHNGENVKKGQKILTLYSETKTRLREAVRFYNEENIIKIIIPTIIISFLYFIS